MKVSLDTLQLHGAVSKETVIEMCEGALKNSQAQLSIAITGLDEAATDKDKKGIVWFGMAGIEKKTVTFMYQYKGNRALFAKKVIVDALKILINYIK